MSTDFYDRLGLKKDASEAEIKKAYRKLAMEHHPDRNQGDKKAEKKFKEINEAYETLSDSKKRKQYDMFWSTSGGGFSGFGGNANYGSHTGFSGFEDLFSSFWGGGFSSNHSESFDFSDVFSGAAHTSTKQQKSPPKKEEENLDVEEVKEIPFLDFLLGAKIAIRTVYGKNLDLTIKSGTKPWTRFKIAGKGRTSGWKTGDMYVKVEAKMPKEIPEDIAKLLESIKYRL